MIPLRTTVPFVRVPWATLALGGLNIAAFVYELALAPGDLEPFIKAFGVVPERQLWALWNQPWRLELWLLPIFTSMFLHGGWLHLIFNMLFLWVFGSGVEQRLGAWRLLLFYLACGVLASQAQLLSDPLSTVPMIGASGAIAGVLGAFLVLFPLAAVEVLIPIFIFPLIFLVPSLVFLVIWFLQQILLGTADSMAGTGAGGVAWWAHAGGFVSGLLLVRPLRKHPPLPPRRPPSVRRMVVRRR